MEEYTGDREMESRRLTSLTEACMEMHGASRSRPFVYHVQPDGRTTGEAYTLCTMMPKNPDCDTKSSLVVHICCQNMDPIVQP